MKISEILGIGKTQFELDFVDIDVDGDLPLFIDPIYISKANTPMINKMYSTLSNFFDYLMELINMGNITEARNIFLNLNEVNDIHLGLSKNKARGNGIGEIYQKDIFDNILFTAQKHEGLLNQIQDIKIFVQGIDRDRISDMIANIIKKELIDYTKQQCDINNIPLTSGVQTGFFWDPIKKLWENKLDDMLVIDGKRIILVPRLIVSYAKEYTASKFVQHFALNYLQEQNIINNTSLVQRYTNKKGKTRIWVTKKSIRKKEKEDGKKIDKDWIANFAQKNPKIFNDFSEQMRKIKVDGDINTEGINKIDIAKFLKRKLEEVQVGTENASKYHDLIIGILEFLFYPNLSNPRKETPIHERRKRIDITFENSAENGFFYNLPTIHQISSSLIMIECKNYKEDIGNPEVDQLAGRFSVNRGKFGMLLFRSINDEKLLMNRCKDICADKSEIIIPLMDRDLNKALDSIIGDTEENIEKIIADKFFEIIKN